MKKNFVLDASALIAFLNDEFGADKVEEVFQKSIYEEDIQIYMNKLNILEIYYGVYRIGGEATAENILTKVLSLPLIVIDTLMDDVFKEAGRLKAKYKISLADSIALAEAKTREAQILTADHHEFDYLDSKKEVEFYWIR